MIDANLANFETEVVEASRSLPVLVDLWAPWCGPCRTLGPILEKLETAYEGRFKLVKINTEDEQDLAAAFGVRSIPMVVLLKDGQPVDGFVGALPEGQIRQFLDRHVPPAAEQPEDLPEEPEPPLDAGAALEQMQQALATNPADDALRGQYVKLLLQGGRLDDARRAFEPLAGRLAIDSLASALKEWMDAIDAAAQAPADEALRARIAADRRDFAARFALAQRAMAQRQWTAAMDELLEILMRDKAWGDQAARKAYVAVLELMAPPPQKTADGQPPVVDPTVESYRRRLSMIVLS
ncbi:MAG: thioredoxin [Betaproteobacteria bacterium]|nr:thioredoxin [Betaproteobacteria bacterium]MBU6513532.1 thioredoxin [Betaproteobacteria bacterium]MDE1956895.1 thioredoxin [Betaproteobacteria bacterium]MDE2153573.1 thioredoxin [Betaproteobacteria bacterium]MDE2479515.1 thioredoxin [Betaproteobacteria bacterium]